MAMIETVEAVDNLEAILDTPGLDGVYIGPADLSISMGLPKAATSMIHRCEKRCSTSWKEPRRAA